MLVERRFEIVRILARDPPLFDAGFQLRNNRVEINGAVGCGRMSRIRRHSVNLAEHEWLDGLALPFKS